MTDRIAPGHVYQPSLGTGIEWRPKLAKLWEGGKVTETSAHNTPDPYTYWRTLSFANGFPSVTHWWFRSAWTQRVRLTRPQQNDPEGAIWGYMQFVDENTPAQPWTATETTPAIIAAPYPPNEVQPVNLPLRLGLARLVVGMLADDVPADEWMVMTSLVRRDDLATVFAAENAPDWQLEGIDTSLREALCWLQGLKRSR